MDVKQNYVVERRLSDTFSNNKFPWTETFRSESASDARNSFCFAPIAVQHSSGDEIVYDYQLRREIVLSEVVESK